MKKIFLAILFFIFCASTCFAADPWSKKDMLLEGLCAGINVLDYASTDRILSTPSRAIELNPLLGSHPSRNNLIAYAVGSTAIHALITNYLPARYRPAWQYGWISVKVLVVANNYHVMMGIQF